MNAWMDEWIYEWIDEWMDGGTGGHSAIYHTCTYNYSCSKMLQHNKTAH